MLIILDSLCNQTSPKLAAPWTVIRFSVVCLAIRQSDNAMPIYGGHHCHRILIVLACRWNWTRRLSHIAVQGGPSGFYTGNWSVQYAVLETVYWKEKEIYQTSSIVLQFPVLNTVGPACAHICTDFCRTILKLILTFKRNIDKNHEYECRGIRDSPF